MNKSIVSTAVVTAMGVAAGLATTAVSTTASAAAISGFTIADVGSNLMGSGAYSSATDGVSASFNFTTAYINVKSYAGTTKFFGDVPSGTIFDGAGANSTGSFSTGFLFSGLPFIPFTFGSGLTGTATGGDGGVTISSLNFGGQFAGGVDFLLFPDAGFPLQILWSKKKANTTDEWDVAMRWGHLITTAEDATSQFTGFTAQWTLEGCVTTNASGKCTSGIVPVPAAAWLFGSGLVGLVGVARRRKAKKA